MKVDQKMIEMADIYHLSFMTRVKYIYLPAMFPNLYKKRLLDKTLPNKKD